MGYGAWKWKQLKAEYENSDITIMALAKKHKLSRVQLQNTKKLEGWTKFSYETKVEEHTQNLTAKKFAMLGVAKEDVLIKIREGIFLPEETEKKIAERILELATRSEDGEETIDHMVIEQFCAMLKKLSDDKKLSLEYIKEYNKMTGGYAPVKKEVTGADGNPLLPENMAILDLDMQIKNLLISVAK